MGGKSYLWMSIMLKEFSVDKTRRLRQFHRLFILKYKILYCLIHYLVTSSSFMANYYATHMGIPEEKIIVIPNWVDLNRFDRNLYQRQEVRKELKLTAEKTMILFVHGLEYGKGVHDLPDIIQGVSKERPDVLFVIVGDGSQKGWLNQEIKKRGLNEVVRQPGAISQREIPKYYAAADLFILPSRYEEFTRVLLEAMAMGVPFVATDGGRGSTKAYTSPKQQEYLVEAGNISKFCQIVVQLIDDQNQRKELAQEGLAFVKNYSESIAINNFMTKIVAVNTYDS
jgi:glycosyltransferase involved in cell wall biosynthesis